MLISLQSTFTVKSQEVKYRIAVTKKRSRMVSLTGKLSSNYYRPSAPRML